MPTTTMRKKRIGNYDIIAKFIDELDRRYGNKVISVIAMGSRGTKEANEEGDVDVEVVFKHDFFGSELTSELRDLLCSLGIGDKIEVWAMCEKEIKENSFSVASYPKEILRQHINGTGVILKGKNLLRYFKVGSIPKNETKELLTIAWRDFKQGNFAKAVIKAAYALVLNANGGKPVEIRNHLYYSSICAVAQRYLREQDFVVVYKALQAKRNNTLMNKNEAERFLKFTEKELSEAKV
jgi:predicted nucleotidyltransferase